jgi:geranylgeranyl reductase family protein
VGDGPVLTADVVVVGGGPGGCAAAITLARAGRDVVLVDRARFPRDKCCGDGLTAGALRRLDGLGLEPGAVASWLAVDGAWVRSPSGRVAAFPMPRGQGTYAAVARRTDLDAALLDAARAAGVKVHDGHAMTAARVGPAGDRVDLDIEGIGPVAARYAVGADGMWSPLRKALDPRPEEPTYLGDWHAVRQYFRSVDGPAAHQLWVLFEPDLLPGYAWTFPLPDGRVNIGFGIVRRPGQPTSVMKQQWPDLLGRPHIRNLLGEGAEPEAPLKAWPIPARTEAASLVAGGGRVLFVGDAARVTDPMTGEGIGQALETGELAAEAIVAAGALESERAAGRYRTAVMGAMAVDNGMSVLLSRVLKHRKGARGAVRIASTNEWTRRNFARWMFEDYPRAVLLTPARWRRGMLSGAGAFRA